MTNKKLDIKLNSVSIPGRHSHSSSTNKTHVCHLVLSDSLQPHGLWPTRLLCPCDSPGKNTGVGSHSLLQGIFQTQGSNLHCRQVLYCLSHQRSPARHRSDCKIYKYISINPNQIHLTGAQKCLQPLQCYLTGGETWRTRQSGNRQT